MKYELGVIGLGVMGEGILSRLLDENKFSASSVCVFDIDKSKINNYCYNVKTAESVKELVENSRRVFFSVKPQHYLSACSGVNFSDVEYIYSIMAGVKTADLRANLKFNGGIVRIMPNVPCRLGKGVCGVTFNQVNEAEQGFAKDILSVCGSVVVTKEENFDAITSVSGSGPAYVYMFAQGMIQGGLNGGLTYEESKALALNTLIGAAEIAKSSTESLDVLVERVCSKGGTTIEAVNVFRENKLVEIIAEGVDACRRKSKILSETL